MKTNTKRLLAMLMAAGMLLSAVACAKSDPTEGETQGATGSVTEEETGYKPNIAKTNYNTDFFIMNYSSILDDVLFVADESTRGDPMADSVYERALNIKDHLGVTIKLTDAGSTNEYATVIRRNVQSGEDAHQLVMTHGLIGAGTLVSGNCLYNYADFEDVNLDAPYWAGELMEEIRVEDKYYLGYGDLCLSEVLVVIANKDLMDEYKITAPYEDVRNYDWTLDKMISLASLVSKDNGDGKWDEKDTYGISGLAWIPFISFVTSSDMKIVEKDGDGVFSIAYSRNADKMTSLIDKLTQMHDADYSYFWPHTTGVELDFANGTTMFQLYHSSSLEILRAEEVRFGILPYPTYDANQKEYKSLNWNGLIAVPTTISNPDMVGETLELMNYYSADVKLAYHEKLLGTKLADSPDDAEMLDIIWDSQTSDVGLICCNSSYAMDNLVYLVPTLVGGYDSRFSYASLLQRNMKAAQGGLDKVFKQ